LFYWGVFQLAVTLYIAFIQHEEKAEIHEDDEVSVSQTFSIFWDILKKPHVQLLIAFWVVAKSVGGIS